jgi:beta-lactamase class A
VSKIIFILSLSISVNVFASDISKCDFGGKFKNIVFKTLGEKMATEQTSFGIEIYNVSSGELLCKDSVSDHQNIYPASTIKTLIAIAVLRKIDAGTISWTDSVKITQPNANDECIDSSCEQYGYGKSRTIEQLMWDMITVSNNVATNQLIDVASKTFINETASLLDASGIKILRKVYSHVEAEPEIKTPNEANAYSLVQVYREVATGFYRVLSKSSREKLTEILKNQKINGSLNKHFPSNVAFYHKTGNTSSVTGDGGFYYLGSDTVVVLVGLQNFNKLDSTLQTGFASLAQIGHEAYHLTLTFK